MRTGQLLIEKKIAFRLHETCFNEDTGKSIFITDSILQKLTYPNNCVDVWIRDVHTKERFVVFHPDQTEYLLKMDIKETVKFFVLPGTMSQAVVLCKSMSLLSPADHISQVVDEYGKYVAIQKEQKRGAKCFMEWLHEICV